MSKSKDLLIIIAGPVIVVLCFQAFSILASAAITVMSQQAANQLVLITVIFAAILVVLIIAMLAMIFVILAVGHLCRTRKAK